MTTITSEIPSPTLQQTTSTKTSSPIMQPTNFSNPTSTTIHKNVMIALVSKDYGATYLVTLGTGDRQKLEISGDTIINVIGWAIDGCGFFVETEKNRIIKVDNQGSVLGEIANINSLNLEAAITQIIVSPDEQWMALILGTGNQEFSNYEFQNLAIISSKDPKDIFKLTEDGVVNGVAWKSDSTMIAFTDIDNDNIQQIFVSSPNGSNRTQITHQNKKSLTIRSLKWSPSGQKIAFVVHNEENQESYLGIIEPSDSDNINYTYSVIGVNEFFWLPNGKIIADILPRGKDPNKLADRTITWFDSDTSQEVGRISSDNLPGEIYQMLGQLANSESIGFFSDGSFYTYDTTSMQLEKGFSMFTDVRYWISAPKEINEKSCKNPKKP